MYVEDVGPMSILGINQKKKLWPSRGRSSSNYTIHAYFGDVLPPDRTLCDVLGQEQGVDQGWYLDLVKT